MRKNNFPGPVTINISRPNLLNSLSFHQNVENEKPKANIQAGCPAEVRIIS